MKDLDFLVTKYIHDKSVNLKSIFDKTFTTLYEWIDAEYFKKSLKIGGKSFWGSKEAFKDIVLNVVQDYHYTYQFHSVKGDVSNRTNHNTGFFVIKNGTYHLGSNFKKFLKQNDTTKFSNFVLESFKHKLKAVTKAEYTWKILNGFTDNQVEEEDSYIIPEKERAVITINSDYNKMQVDSIWSYYLAKKHTLNPTSRDEKIINAILDILETERNLTAITLRKKIREITGISPSAFTAVKKNIQKKVAIEELNDPDLQHYWLAVEMRDLELYKVAVILFEETVKKLSIGHRKHWIARYNIARCLKRCGVLNYQPELIHYAQKVYNSTITDLLYTNLEEGFKKFQLAKNYNGIAHVYEELFDRKKSFISFAKALELFPNNSNYMVNCMGGLYELEFYEEIKLFYKYYVSNKPELLKLLNKVAEKLPESQKVKFIIQSIKNVNS